MKASVFGARISSSLLFKIIKSRAASYLRNPRKLNELMEDVARKSSGSASLLSQTRDSMKALLRMARAYARGDYTGISRSKMIIIIATLLYFLMPTDILPDFILGMGLMDDIALIGWTMKTLKKEIEEFRNWESKNCR